MVSGLQDAEGSILFPMLPMTLLEEITQRYGLNCHQYVNYIHSILELQQILWRQWKQRTVAWKQFVIDEG